MVQLAVSKETRRVEASGVVAATVIGVVPPVPSGTPGGPVAALIVPVRSA